MHQEAQHLLHLAAPLGAHKAVDEIGVDLGPEPRRRDQGQARHPVRLPQREDQGDRAAHRMPDQMRLVDAERGERAVEIGGKALPVDRRVQYFRRAAMARQIERHRAAGLGQRRLDEHPAIEVGAEAVHE